MENARLLLRLQTPGFITGTCIDGIVCFIHLEIEEMIQDVEIRGEVWAGKVGELNSSIHIYAQEFQQANSKRLLKIL